MAVKSDSTQHTQTWGSYLSGGFNELWPQVECYDWFLQRYT